MKGVVGFENHKITCIIGVYPEEKEKEQEIFVDLKVETEFGSSDDLADTVDYVELANLCTELAENNRYQLLETFVGDALKKIMEQFPVSWAWMRVKKPGGLETADHSVVEMRLP